jgi:hypothetical protein
MLLPHVVDTSIKACSRTPQARSLLFSDRNGDTEIGQDCRHAVFDMGDRPSFKTMWHSIPNQRVNAINMACSLRKKMELSIEETESVLMNPRK